MLSFSSLRPEPAERPNALNLDAISVFGLLNLDKPSGKTSRDVVNYVQRLVRPIKTGHAGTLDPLADGVLLVPLGAATRLTEYLHRLPKQYRATFLLGRTSDTEDIQGNLTLLPNPVSPSADDLDRVIPQFLGDILQRPPVYSALKVAGRRAYQLARAGQAVELTPRLVRIHALQVEEYDYPQLRVRVTCGSGTYIRSLGRDLAEAVGTGAVLSALTRTAVGPFSIEQSVSLEELDRDSMADHLLSPLLALPDVPHVVLTAAQQQRVANGQSIELDSLDASEIAATDEQGRLLAILVRRGQPGMYGPRRNFCHA